MPILLTQDIIAKLEENISGLIVFMSDKVDDPEPYYLHIKEGYNDTFHISSYSKDRQQVQEGDIPIIDLVVFNNYFMDRWKPDYAPDMEAIHEVVISFLNNYISSKS